MIIRGFLLGLLMLTLVAIERLFWPQLPLVLQAGSLILPVLLFLFDRSSDDEGIAAGAFALLALVFLEDHVRMLALFLAGGGALLLTRYVIGRRSGVSFALLALSSALVFASAFLPWFWGQRDETFHIITFFFYGVVITSALSFLLRSIDRRTGGLFLRRTKRGI